ncbi:MAG: transporter substrate-binding domain-containing protein [Rhodobacteraceae bacterium]|nr:transporter substrate-binding domain-containing protein [Paracoccaceae bacterium]
MKFCALASAVAIAVGISAPAFAQTACQSYTVARGDFLDRISETAYGHDDAVNLLYSANRAVIGRNRNNLEIGMVLEIPCLGAQPAQGKQVDRQEIHLVSGGDASQIVGQNIQNGGIFIDIIDSALQLADEGQPHSINTARNLDTHLEILLSNGTYDISFPWFVPDCTNLAPLGKNDLLICSSFIASRPFYEVAIGMYSRADSRFATANRMEHLVGANICRPAGNIDFDLLQTGVNLTLHHPATDADCINGVMDGTYDVFTFNALRAEKTMRTLGISSSIQEIEPLASVQTLHALAPANHPDSRTNIAQLNRGLRDLTLSGRWFAIVARYLGQH